MSREKFATVLLLFTVSFAAAASDHATESQPYIVNTAAGDAKQVSWADDVMPVLEQRCIVCHGCYDAPCQLKLSSFAGLMRGANPDKVYDGSRILVAQPTRLGIDATTPKQWQEKGFHSVLGEQGKDRQPQQTLLYQMLKLKQQHPQPDEGLLPPDITLGLDRKQQCVQQQDFDDFAKDNPMWGMPYGMPNLSDRDYDTLVRWLEEGAKPSPPVRQSTAALAEVAAWEKFLNGSSLREKLVSRYLYEHLFLGHLYLSADQPREFYRLVRSYTAPGQPVREIPTVRPFDDPGVTQFWYRLRRYDAAIVAKSHVIYEFSAATRARYQELFLDPDYAVDELPDYKAPETSNPFKTFAAIPSDSRYRFMLDDARFFIQGFIKGPVCRGQVALNVIEDQFWVFFADPANVMAEDRERVLDYTADFLQMPTSINTLNLLSAYSKYWELQKKYLAARTTFLKVHMPPGEFDPFDLVWDGDGTNPNAALTVFRNFDSAAVEFGLLGNYPETAWIIDYPLFERIHYLLVAGFDVYGNVGHQLNTRLFMDFLRMEGEDNFLLFLPPEERKKVRDSWYRGIRESREKYFEEPLGWLDIDLPIEFQTQNMQQEVYDLLIQRVSAVANPVDELNRCGTCAIPANADAAMLADARLREITKVKGAQLATFPHIAFIRVQMDEGEDRAYTMVLNKEYLNLSSLLQDGDSQKRDPDNDTLTLLHGFSGTYPNFYFVVPFADLQTFVRQASSINNMDEYHALAARFGIRRTNENYWQQADWFQAHYAELEPIEAGIFDLNRYDNR